MCQCWCGCRRRPGRGCRRHCPVCSRLVGPGCCWMGDDVGLCHMCYQRDAGRSEEELSVEQHLCSETASDVHHSRRAVAILYAVITGADANDSDTSKRGTEGRASLVRAPGARRQRGLGSAASPGSSGCSGSLAAVVDACPAGIGGFGRGSSGRIITWFADDLPGPQALGGARGTRPTPVVREVGQHHRHHRGPQGRRRRPGGSTLWPPT